jgi:hypothetical protein
MICDRCGAKYTKKAARLHICPKPARRRPATYKRGREGVMTDAERDYLEPKGRWTQLDLFEEFVNRGRWAQAAVDALTKRRRIG